MQLTHLGHAAVLLETSSARILVDPGNFSTEWHGLTDLDVIVITHQHPDHIDPESVPTLLAANPQAKVLTEPGVPATLEIEGAVEFTADTDVTIGGLRLTGAGRWHAVIHRDIPRIGNVGVVVSGEGEPTFFHPGDSLETVPDGVDIAAVPAYGPWAAMKETIDFARALAAPKGFLIHDGLLGPRGWNLVFGRLNAMTETEFTDLRGIGAVSW